MLEKIINKLGVPKELVGKLKVIYIDNELTLFNYLELISIDTTCVKLKEISVYGTNLKVVYQDPIKIKIKGEIKEVRYEKDEL